MQTIHYAIKADLSMHILTIDVIRSKVDLNIESFISIFDSWQGEVRRGFLGKIWHHSLWKKTTRKIITLELTQALVHTHNYLLISQLPTLTMDFKCSKGLHFALLV